MLIFCNKYVSWFIATIKYTIISSKHIFKFWMGKTLIFTTGEQYKTEEVYSRSTATVIWCSVLRYVMSSYILKNTTLSFSHIITITNAAHSNISIVNFSVYILQNLARFQLSELFTNVKRVVRNLIVIWDNYKYGFGI